MRLVLASYFEQENHGEGRKIGISSGKPKDLPYECNLLCEELSPGQAYFDYHRNKKTDPENAATIFTETFQAQLDALMKRVEEEGLSEVLPEFEDGDTLLSWEKSGHLSYRAMVAKTLRKLGFEVIEN